MARYSPVGPVEVLLQMKERGFLDGYLLLLAHDVVDKPHQYEKLLNGFEGTIILDNSLIELGVPVDANTMVLGAAIVKPDFVVLPDKLNDAKATVEMSREAVGTWVTKLPSRTGCMVAAQGKDPEEAVACAKACIGTSPKLNYIVGVPRAVTMEQGSRVPLVQLLTRQDYKVHLLGMSGNLRDDIMCTRMYGVIGIDSASPLRAGWENMRFDGRTEHLRAREEFFTSCKGFTIDMAYNIGHVRGLMENR